MRRTITAAFAAALLALAGCSSYSAEDCQNAIDDSSTKTNRPKECADLSQEDYDTILLNRAVNDAFNDMDQKDQDLLDYYDDGSINDSIGED
jgi:uncharacterized protein YecT (DUF1311 family)